MTKITVSIEDLRKATIKVFKEDLSPGEQFDEASISDLTIGCDELGVPIDHQFGTKSGVILPEEIAEQLWGTQFELCTEVTLGGKRFNVVKLIVAPRGALVTQDLEADSSSKERITEILNGNFEEYGKYLAPDEVGKSLSLIIDSREVMPGEIIPFGSEFIEVDLINAEYIDN